MKNQNSQIETYIEIPIAHEARERFEFTLKKMKFKYSTGPTRKNSDVMNFHVYYDDPIELYYLGATAIADHRYFFQSGITE